MTRNQVLVVLLVLGCATCVGCMFGAMFAGFVGKPALFAGTVAGAVTAVVAAWLAE